MADESKGSAKEKWTVGNRDEAVQPALTAFGSASTSSNSPITSPAGYQLQSTLSPRTRVSATMSFIRTGGSACFRVSRLAAPVNTRFVSSVAARGTDARKTSPEDAPTTPPKESSLINKETPAEAMARHQPDYNAGVDHGTSTFSPVPKRVMNGSETGTLAAAIVSGAPMDLQARTVRIYRPTKPATQSGTWHGHHWRMDWDILERGHRWENPLMGWQSSADGMQGTHLNFKSKEDAIAFAERQGYEYFVQEPNERKFVPKAYANNFLHSPKKLKHIRTK